MVRRMKLTGRTGALAICLLVVVAAAGLLGSHVFRTARASAGLRCPQDPGIALGCYEQHYRAIVDRQGVAAAFADLKAGYAADAQMQRLCHAITHAIVRAAVRRYSGVAEAFRYGDNTGGSRYYHGLLQGVALTLGRTRLLSDLDAVCAAVPGKERKSLDCDNCVHGVRHGIVAGADEDQCDALRHCGGL